MYEHKCKVIEIIPLDFNGKTCEFITFVRLQMFFEVPMEDMRIEVNPKVATSLL
jgi:hypothetical protein